MLKRRTGLTEARCVKFIELRYETFARLQLLFQLISKLSGMWGRLGLHHRQARVQRGPYRLQRGGVFQAQEHGSI
jgi:hypothetical protein